MQKRKRDHWVAQSYLRTFAADPKSSKIWRLSNREGDPELKPIEKVAVRFHLYTPRDASGTRDYSFEEKLAKLECWFGEPAWKALCADYVDLSWEPLRKMVALLTAVMWLRNPKFLEYTRTLHRQMVDFYSRLPSIPDQVKIGGRVLQLDHSRWEEYRNADDEAIKRMWIDQIGTAASIADALLKMRWGFLFVEEPFFITTDNPVVTMNPGLKFKGLKHAETILLFPVSPTRVLFMDNRHSEPDGRYYPADDPASLNMLLWRESLDHMFSSRHPDHVCWEMDLSARRAGF